MVCKQEITPPLKVEIFFSFFFLMIKYNSLLVKDHFK